MIDIDIARELQISPGGDIVQAIVLGTGQKPRLELPPVAGDELKRPRVYILEMFIIEGRTKEVAIRKFQAAYDRCLLNLRGEPGRIDHLIYIMARQATLQSVPAHGGSSILTGIFGILVLPK